MLFDLFGALNCFKQMFFHCKIINKLSYPYSHIYSLHGVSVLRVSFTPNYTAHAQSYFCEVLVVTDNCYT